MLRNNSEKERIFIRRGAIICSLAALIALVGEGVKVGAEILAGPPFAVVVSAFTAGGGEFLPVGGGRTLVGSIGGTGVARMTGGVFTIKTGIIGAVDPSGETCDNAHAYPNPYIPSQQGNVGVTFSQLTGFATVRIYTLAGELVQKLEKNDIISDRLAWSPVANMNGQPVASGVYIFVAKCGNGQTKTGKVMVIR